MNLVTIYDVCKNKDVMKQRLRDWGLILHEVKCSECDKAMTLEKNENALDGFQWRCYNKKRERKQKPCVCGNSINFRKGTFFQNSKLTICQILSFVNLWVINASLSLIKTQLAISTDEIVVNWASYCREVLLNTFLANPTKIGGIGEIVKIDESNFGKRKYNRGHRVEGQLVFGGYERGSGRIFMVAVEFRDKDTLLPIIKDWIEDGTTIISDYWKAYDCLEGEGFSHLKVNHSLNFKDPETGAHINSIDSSWRHAKHIASSYGLKKNHIPGNLARYMFFKKCKELNLDRTLEFFRLAGQLYSPNNLNAADELLEQEDSILRTQDPLEDLAEFYEELR